MADHHRRQLVSILSPSRLAAIHNMYFAWFDHSSSPTSASLLGLFQNDIAAPLYDLCYTQALAPLAEIPLDEMPPPLSYLPVPESTEFPVQALGLHLLLDQVPRQVLRGIDTRWTFGFFGERTLRLARDLAALPIEMQPQRTQRWQALGYSFEAAWLRAFLQWTAFIHAEDRDAHRFGQRMIEEECRKGAEAHYGVPDPTRELQRADDEDLTLFAKMRIETAARVAPRAPVEGMWTLCRIVRAHEPIIRAFGRYPYRNGAMGRDEREGEAEFLRDTGGLEVSDSETTKRVRDDVAAGRYTPLRGVHP